LPHRRQIVAASEAAQLASQEVRHAGEVEVRRLEEGVTQIDAADFEDAAEVQFMAAQYPAKVIGD